MRWMTLIAILASTVTANAEGLVCVAEKAVGYRFDATTRDWEPRIFKTSGTFVVTRAPPEQTNMKWLVKSVGEDEPVAYCFEDFSKVGELGCRLIDKFTFNKNALTYSRYSTFFHYMSPVMLAVAVEKGESVADMVFEIGSCTPLMQGPPSP